MTNERTELIKQVLVDGLWLYTSVAGKGMTPATAEDINGGCALYARAEGVNGYVLLQVYVREFNKYRVKFRDVISYYPATSLQRQLSLDAVIPPEETKSPPKHADMLDKPVVFVWVKSTVVGGDSSQTYLPRPVATIDKKSWCRGMPVCRCEIRIGPTLDEKLRVVDDKLLRCAGNLEPLTYVITRRNPVAPVALRFLSFDPAKMGVDVVNRSNFRQAINVAAFYTGHNFPDLKEPSVLSHLDVQLARFSSTGFAAVTHN